VGDLQYPLAARLTRLELADVSSSIAPAMTVMLFGLVARQSLPPSQPAGVVRCLIAVALLAVSYSDLRRS
jgi:hypothetical protein